jgi:hypothetical protein
MLIMCLDHYRKEDPREVDEALGADLYTVPNGYNAEIQSRRLNTWLVRCFCDMLYSCKLAHRSKARNVWCSSY